MVSGCELLINVVNLDKPKTLTGLGQIGMRSVIPLANGNTRTFMIAGKEAEPNPRVSPTWNTVNPIHRPTFQNRDGGRRPAREAVGGAGKGWWKKRRLGRNGSDKDSSVVPT